MSEKIPFDVEKWETGNYEAVYRNGEKPIEILFSKHSVKWSIITITNYGESLTHHINGSSYHGKDESSYTLFLTPKKKKVWFVISEKDGNVHGAIFTHDGNIDNYKKIKTAEGYKIVHEAEFEY